MLEAMVLALPYGIWKLVPQMWRYITSKRSASVSLKLEIKNV